MTPRVLLVLAMSTLGLITLLGILFSSLSMQRAEPVLSSHIALASQHLAAVHDGTSTLSPDQGVTLLEASLEIQRGTLRMMQSTRRILFLVAVVAIMGAGCLVLLLKRLNSSATPRLVP